MSTFAPHSRQGSGNDRPPCYVGQYTLDTGVVTVCRKDQEVGSGDTLSERPEYTFDKVRPDLQESLGHLEGTRVEGWGAGDDGSGVYLQGFRYTNPSYLPVHFNDFAITAGSVAIGTRISHQDGEDWRKKLTVYDTLLLLETNQDGVYDAYNVTAGIESCSADHTEATLLIQDPARQFTPDVSYNATVIPQKAIGSDRPGSTVLVGTAFDDDLRLRKAIHDATHKWEPLSFRLERFRPLDVCSAPAGNSSDQSDQAREEDPDKSSKMHPISTTSRQEFETSTSGPASAAERNPTRPATARDADSVALSGTKRGGTQSSNWAENAEPAGKRRCGD